MKIILIIIGVLVIVTCYRVFSAQNNLEIFGNTQKNFNLPASEPLIEGKIYDNGQQNFVQPNNNPTKDEMIPNLENKINTNQFTISFVRSSDPQPVGGNSQFYHVNVDNNSTYDGSIELAIFHDTWAVVANPVVSSNILKEKVYISNGLDVDFVNKLLGKVTYVTLNGRAVAFSQE